MTTRRVKATSLLPPLRLQPGRLLSDVVIPPTISAGLLIVTRRGSLAAFDEQTGLPRWTVPLSAVEDQQPHGGAAFVVDEFVYVRSGDDLLKVELSTGELKEQHVAPRFDLKDGAFIDGCIVSFTPGGELTAWDINRRASRWSLKKEFSPVPLVGSEGIVVVGEMGAISAYRISDGKQIWSVELESGAAIGALAFAPDGSVIAAITPEIISLEAKTGEVRWRAIGDVARTGTMAVTEDGEIHLLDLRRYRRLSAGSGVQIFAKELARDQLPKVRGSLGRLAVSETHVFAGDLRGPIVAISRAGEVDWKCEEERPRAASSAPVLSDERLYALTFDGTLQCFVELDESNKTRR